MFSLPGGRFWTVPNILSLSRIVLLPLWWIVMSSENRLMWWWGAALIVYGIISDILDGFIARRLNQISDWGKILDPVGDKIAAGVVGIFCVLYRGMPLVAFILMLGRDLLLVLGGSFVLRRSGVVPSSINVGRVSALLWGVTLLLYSFDWQPYGRWLLWPVVVFYLITGIVYTMRGGRALTR